MKIAASVPNPYSSADIAASIAATRELLNYPRSIRPAKTGGQKRAGNILVLPARDTYVVGDLHANGDNLRRLIAYGEDRGIFREANVLLLGDILHSVQNPGDSAASLDALMTVFGLMIRYPEHVFCLRGNHETISDGLVKFGVQISRCFNDFIRSTYGQPMLFELGKAFNELPLIALGENLVACHAGPAQGEVAYEPLLNAFPDDVLYSTAIDSRNYTAHDVTVFINALNGHPYPYSANTLFVVGHHRLEGERAIRGGFKNIPYHFALQSHHVHGLSLLKVARNSWEVIELVGKLNGRIPPPCPEHNPDQANHPQQDSETSDR